MQAILRLGADVNHVVEKKGGVSAMHLAAGIPGDSGLEIMRALLSHGGDANIKLVIKLSHSQFLYHFDECLNLS